MEPVTPPTQVVPAPVPDKRTRRQRDYDTVMELLMQGESKLEIARRMGVTAKTVYNIIASGGAKGMKSMVGQAQREAHAEAVERASSKIQSRLPELAEMVIDQTIKMKDRQSGVNILREVGVLEKIRPKVAQESDSGRIVIEWSGAPPPWAPKHVLDAYAQARAATPALTAAHTNVPPNTHQPDTCAKVGTDAETRHCPSDVVDVVVEDLPHKTLKEKACPVETKINS